MSQFKPSVLYQKRAHNSAPIKTESFTQPTYAEVKKNMRKFLEESYDDIVRVYRSRRGEWGEWFEIWEIGPKGNPFISKQGWQ